MRKTLLAMGLLTLSLMATDFTKLTTQELMAMRGTVSAQDRIAFRAEMKSRMALMTAEEKATLRDAKGQATGQQLKDGSGNRKNMPRNELNTTQQLKDGSDFGKGMGRGKGQRKMPPTFADFDADGDGKITQTELETAQANKMTNQTKEGKLLKNAQNAPAFSTLDTNGDGSLDTAEFEAHQATAMKNHKRPMMGGQGMGQRSSQVEQ